MRFAHPLWFLALLSLPLLYFLLKNRQVPPAILFPLKVPTTLQIPRWDRWLLVLKLFLIACLIFILARPQNSFKKLERTVNGVDIMMLLDVSASMNIEDLGAEARIEIAKNTMKTFIQARGTDRIGVLIFSGEAITLAPPTLDYALLVKSLQTASTGLLKDGTAIGDGLAVAVSHLRLSQAKSRVIILLTDGDSNTGQIDPVTAGDLAAGYGIRVYTIGIGREGPVKMPVEVQTPFGQTIKTYQMMNQTLNPELLKNIAEKTKGKFYRVIDEKALEQVFQEIDQLEKTEIHTHEKVRYEELFQKPLVWCLVFLFVLQFLERRFWRFAL